MILWIKSSEINFGGRNLLSPMDISIEVKAYNGQNIYSTGLNSAYALRNASVQCRTEKDIKSERANIESNKLIMDYPNWKPIKDREYDIQVNITYAGRVYTCISTKRHEYSFYSGDKAFMDESWKLSGSY
ncbi:hypothetical protein ABLB84_07010 [Xenorhabdus szentirmaii]|uniref:hypothetical protein n=1 Tax=Xenorhabdus szentirmaii TaxID=290112 RepID=UPI0032B856F3